MIVDAVRSLFIHQNRTFFIDIISQFIVTETAIFVHPELYRLFIDLGRKYGRISGSF